MKSKAWLVLSRLKNPTVVLSIVSNLISLALLLGYKLDESLILSVVTIVCSVFVTLGIMSNPDGTCSRCGRPMEPGDGERR